MTCGLLIEYVRVEWDTLAEGRAHIDRPTPIGALMELHELSAAPKATVQFVEGGALTGTPREVAVLLAHLVDLPAPTSCGGTPEENEA